MAEVLALFGGVSAVCTISKDFTRMGKQLAYYSRTLRYAKEEMDSVVSDTATCAGILLVFDKALAEDESSMAADVRSLRIDEKLSMRSKNLLAKIKAMVKKRLQPMNKRHETSALQRGMARCMWLFHKSEVLDLIGELERVKASVTLCITLLIYCNVKNKASEMEVVPQAIQEQLRTMRDALKGMEKVCMRLERRLEEQHRPEEESQLLRDVAHLAEREVTDSRDRERAQRNLRRRNATVSIVREPERRRNSPILIIRQPGVPDEGPATNSSTSLESNGNPTHTSPGDTPPPPQHPTETTDISRVHDSRFCHICLRVHTNAHEPGESYEQGRHSSCTPSSHTLSKDGSGQ